MLAQRHDRRGQLQGPAPLVELRELRGRITSYNVCYTKLLRKSINDAFVAYSNHDADLARRVIGRKKTFKRITFQLKEHLVNRLTLMDSNRIAKIRFETDLIELIDRLYALSSVITSYSIHYTKLYDLACATATDSSSRKRSRWPIEPLAQPMSPRWWPAHS